MLVGFLALCLLLYFIKYRKTVPEDQWCSGVVGGPAKWDPRAPPELLARVEAGARMVAAAQDAEKMLLLAAGIEKTNLGDLDHIVVLLTIAGMLCGQPPETAALNAAEAGTMVIYSGPLRFVAVSHSADRASDFVSNNCELNSDASLLCVLAATLAGKSWARSTATSTL